MFKLPTVAAICQLSSVVTEIKTEEVPGSEEGSVTSSVADESN